MKFLIMKSYSWMVCVGEVMKYDLGEVSNINIQKMAVIGNHDADIKL